MGIYSAHDKIFITPSILLAPIQDIGTDKLTNINNQFLRASYLNLNILDKISNSRKGIVFSREHLTNLSIAQKKKAKNLSTESKVKLDASRARKRKLTMEQANQIRQEKKNGMLLRELAGKWNVFIAVIYGIIHYKTYINDYQELTI